MRAEEKTTSHIEHGNNEQVQEAASRSPRRKVKQIKTKQQQENVTTNTQEEDEEDQDQEGRHGAAYVIN